VNALLNKKFSNLEDARLSLIEKLKDIPPSKLETSPLPGKWSVSQIFYHLNRAESFSTIYVSKKRLDSNNLKKTGLNEALKMAGLKVIFKMPFALKAPVNVLGDVPEKVEYGKIVAEWNETRIKLKELLESLPDDILYKNVFKQPAIGRVNIFQMVDFMQAHFNRHEKQVERIIKG
jgi:hypothetical protein